MFPSINKWETSDDFKNQYKRENNLSDKLSNTHTPSFTREESAWWGSVPGGGEQRGSAGQGEARPDLTP